MVRGRYLATFSCNSFGITRKVVAAAVLVATYGEMPSLLRLLAFRFWLTDQGQKPDLATCCYVATNRINSGSERAEHQDQYPWRTFTTEGTEDTEATLPASTLATNDAARAGTRRLSARTPPERLNI